MFGRSELKMTSMSFLILEFEVELQTPDTITASLRSMGLNLKRLPCRFKFWSLKKIFKLPIQ